MPATAKPSKRRAATGKSPPPAAAASLYRPLLPPAELRAAIDRLEEILAPLIAHLGIQDVWREAAPPNLVDLGPLNYFGVKMKRRPGMFARLVRTDAHLFGAFLDGSLRRSVVLHGLTPDELAHAMSDPSDAPTLVVDPRKYPRASLPILDSGILGHHDGAVIAIERTLAGTVVYAITRDRMQPLGTFLELAEQGVATLLPLQP